MVVMGLLGPKFWMGISFQVATAPVQDYFDVLDRRPKQPGAPPAETEREDAMAVAKHLKTAA